MLATDSKQAELDRSSTAQATLSESDSSSAEHDRASLAEIELTDNPFLVQAVHTEGDNTASSSADQVVDQGTFSTVEDAPSLQQATDTLTDEALDSDLTFDQALAQATASGELSDDTANNASSSSTGDLTFAEAVAATRGSESVSDVIANSTQTQSSDSVDDPTAETAILESSLPSLESINGSLTAAFTEPEIAVNVTAGESSSTGVLISLAGSAATGVSEGLSKAASSSESLLGEVSALR